MTLLMGLFSKARSTLRKKAREAEKKEMQRRQKRARQKQALKEATADASTIVKASRPGRATRVGIKAGGKTLDVAEKTLEETDRQAGRFGVSAPDPDDLRGIESVDTPKKKRRGSERMDDLDIDLDGF